MGKVSVNIFKIFHCMLYHGAQAAQLAQTAQYLYDAVTCFRVRTCTLGGPAITG